MTDEGASLVIWGVVEAAVTIVAASIPVLRVLIRDANKSWLGSRRTRTQTNRGCQSIVAMITVDPSKRGMERVRDDNSQRSIVNEVNLQEHTVGIGPRRDSSLYASENASGMSR